MIFHCLIVPKPIVRAEREYIISFEKDTKDTPKRGDIE